MNNISDKFDNYYELLGVDSKAGLEEIRHAYREKLKEWHPDKNPGRIEAAEEITKTVQAASSDFGYYRWRIALFHHTYGSYPGHYTVYRSFR